MSYTVAVKDIPSRATKDADVVARIRKAGAIPLLVSNTPELCMWWHTFNKITGTTKNPYDTRRTCGGSSGGEVRANICIFIFLRRYENFFVKSVKIKDYYLNNT